MINSTGLAGVHICLVFEHSLSHYSRLREEIRALQQAGATVQLLTSHDDADSSIPNLPRTVVPLYAPRQSLWPPPSTLAWRPARIANNLVRNQVRQFVKWARPYLVRRKRLRTLREMADATNIFWVIDYPSLPLVVRATRGSGAKIVYETVDLVPEYLYEGERHRDRMLAGERRDIAHIDGFITACDSYADYYVEKLGGALRRRPTVRDNMPAHIVTQPSVTGRPVRLLFFGSLLFDRPLDEIIEAMSLVTSDVTLTIQGKNVIGDGPARSIARLGLEDRVTIVEPCPPQSIVDAVAEYDVGIVVLRGDNENERRASTSKLFTYMAAGLAVLGSDLPGIARVLLEHRNGFLVSGLNPHAWAEAIDNLATLSDQEIDNLKYRSIEAAHRHAWQSQRADFVAEFRRALDDDATKSTAGVAIPRGVSRP